MTTTEILLVCVCAFIAINTICMCIGLYRQQINHAYVHAQLRTPPGSLLEVGSFPSGVAVEQRAMETSFTTPVAVVVEPAPADTELDEWIGRMSAAAPESLRFMRDFYSERVRGLDTLLSRNSEIKEVPVEPVIERFEIVPGSVREHSHC